MFPRSATLQKRCLPSSALAIRSLGDCVEMWVIARASARVDFYKVAYERRGLTRVGARPLPSGFLMNAQKLPVLRVRLSVREDIQFSQSNFSIEKLLLVHIESR